VNVNPSGSRRLDTAVNCQYSMLCYVHSCKLNCNMILVRNINCLLVSCVIYAGESGGFDGAGAAGDVFSHTGLIECKLTVAVNCVRYFVVYFVQW